MSTAAGNGTGALRGRLSLAERVTGVGGFSAVVADFLSRRSMPMRVSTTRRAPPPFGALPGFSARGVLIRPELEGGTYVSSGGRRSASLPRSARGSLSRFERGSSTGPMAATPSAGSIAGRTASSLLRRRNRSATKGAGGSERCRSDTAGSGALARPVRSGLTGGAARGSASGSFQLARESRDRPRSSLLLLDMSDMDSRTGFAAGNPPSPVVNAG